VVVALTRIQFKNNGMYPQPKLLTNLVIFNSRFLGRNLSKTNSIDVSELQHFKQFTEEWWTETGHLRALHSMNRLRIPLIRDGIINVAGTSQQKTRYSKPLEGVTILDVGCGGGILSEPLARIGGNVTGIDPNSDLVEKARSHIKNENFKLEYLCSSVEEYAVNNKEKYDAVVASEILEHVSRKEEFLAACVSCLKPGGSFFATTINKTFVANFLGILLAENLVQLLPKGTHQYEKFIKPHKLHRLLGELNCKTVLTNGLSYNVITNNWFWCSNDSINYALHAVKLKQM
jgi:polyprenyldihydroxybenzoate methyltransferase/3-demethylubiquinol 3-O-methyltransferase